VCVETKAYPPPGKITTPVPVALSFAGRYTSTVGTLTPRRFPRLAKNAAPASEVRDLLRYSPVLAHRSP